jgi:hypothetical protein
MIYGILSFIASAVCLVIFFKFQRKTKTSGEKAKIAATAAFVRISFFLCLCAVPFLVLISILLNSVKLFFYAEAAITVEGAATLLIGLVALLQRYGANFFKMPPALGLEEILVLIFLPVILYLSYLPSNFIILYYIGPGIYSVYLTYKLLKDND